MRCPHCRGKLLQKAGSTIRLRTDGVHTFREDGTCVAQCHWCGETVEVPVYLSKTAEVDVETLVVKATIR